MVTEIVVYSVLSILGVIYLLFRQTALDWMDEVNKKAYLSGKSDRAYDTMNDATFIVILLSTVCTLFSAVAIVRALILGLGVWPIPIALILLWVYALALLVMAVFRSKKNDDSRFIELWYSVSKYARLFTVLYFWYLVAFLLFNKPI